MASATLAQNGAVLSHGKHWLGQLEESVLICDHSFMKICALGKWSSLLLDAESLREHARQEGPDACLSLETGYLKLQGDTALQLKVNV